MAQHLPGHIQAVAKSNMKVIWVCDPMHGKYVLASLLYETRPQPCTFLFSTLTSSSGHKTRHFGTIISEIKSCLEIHSQCESWLGGVSLEFTGELSDDGFSVTECLGGSMELSEEQLGLRYQV